MIFEKYNPANTDRIILTVKFKVFQKSRKSFLNWIYSYFPTQKVRLNKLFGFDVITCHIIHYPTPLCLTYAWSFGSLAGLCLSIQIVTGLLLTMYYKPEIDRAFESVLFIMRHVNHGWLLRYTHANGASMFFFLIYLHMAKGIYYGSYFKPRESLWYSGVIILILLMGTAFTGYVLPWGQMSFWGLTVITNMVTVLPGGKTILYWLWGQEVIINTTLKRVYTVHFVLPFVIIGLTFIHLILLHKVGSNSPIGSDTGVDDVPFYPYYFWKDLFAFIVFIGIFGTYVFFFPNVLNHPDNWIPANPKETPISITPEWYFLPFYTVLRAIPYKTPGILLMGGAILILFTLPRFNTSYVRNTTYRPIFKYFYWFFIANVNLLIHFGTCKMKYPYIEFSQFYVGSYFSFFLVAVPFCGWAEHKLATFEHIETKNAASTDSGVLSVPNTAI